MSNKFCEHEDNTLKYFAGQLAQNQLTTAEEHIANCSQCCNTIAQLTKSMFSEETPEEKAFLDKHAINSQEEVSKLVKQSLEAKTSSNSNVVSFLAKTTDAKKNIFSAWKKSYLALVACLGFVLLFGAATFLVLQNKSLKTNSEIAQSIADLKEINSKGRPTDLRLEGFEYVRVKRGQNSVEMQNKLNEVKNILEKQIAVKPTTETLNLLAQANIMDNTYDESINNINKAILLNSTEPSLFTTLAVAYFAKKDYQNALISINKALEFNENYLPAIFNRTLIYSELKQYDKARSDSEKYIKLDANSFWASELKEKVNKLK